MARRQRRRQPGAAGKGHRLWFSQRHRRIRHQLSSGRLPGILPHPPGVHCRRAKHPADRRDGNFARHRHWICRRNRAAFPQPAGGQDGRGLCGDFPQHPPAAADFLLVFRRLAPAAKPAQRLRFHGRRPHQQPRGVFSRADAGKRRRAGLDRAGSRRPGRFWNGQVGRRSARPNRAGVSGFSRVAVPDCGRAAFGPGGLGFSAVLGVARIAGI